MESAVKAAAKSYAASEKVPYEQLSAYGIHSRLKKVAGVDTLLETVQKEEAKGIKSSPASKKEAKLTKAFKTAYNKAFKSMKGGADTSLTTVVDKIIAADEARYENGAPEIYDTGLKEKAGQLSTSNSISSENKADIKRLLDDALNNKSGDITQQEYDDALAALERITTTTGGFRRRSQTARFSRCVKKVRKTVKARKGSTKESAAIGICVKSVLHKRGRTLKSYSKKRLVTQRRK